MMGIFGIGTRRAMLPARPFTAEQEDRLREIIRNEIDADNALRNSRDSVEFGHMFARERSFRPALEKKRNGHRADD